MLYIAVMHLTGRPDQYPRVHQGMNQIGGQRWVRIDPSTWIFWSNLVSSKDVHDAILPTLHEADTLFVSQIRPENCWLSGMKKDSDALARVIQGVLYFVSL